MWSRFEKEVNACRFCGRERVEVEGVGREYLGGFMGWNSEYEVRGVNALLVLCGEDMMCGCGL